MKSLTFAFMILTTTFPFHTANARLGESLEQCISRYGKPLTVNTDGYLNSDVPENMTYNEFEKDGMKICITFMTDRAESISYSPTNNVLPRKDAEYLIQLNSQGGVWGKAMDGLPPPFSFPDSPVRKSIVWFRNDETMAEYIINTKSGTPSKILWIMLQIQSKRYSDAVYKNALEIAERQKKEVEDARIIKPASKEVTNKFKGF